MSLHKFLLAAACSCMLCINAHSQTVLLPFQSTWKFLDNGSNQGTTWVQPGFADAAWSSGPGQLGYGDGDEATVVSYGADANNKYITTYFRTAVSIANTALYSGYTLSVRRDDGIVVYVNGTEVYRNNMPTGTIAYNTLATAAASDDGGTVQTATLAASAFVNGSNTIAVEVHQNAGTSSDLSFDLQLQGTLAPVAPAVLSDYASTWKYLDNGSNQGTAWRSLSFSDATWKTGTAPLGYGNAGVATTVSFGTNSRKKYITTYFRRMISVTDPSLYQTLDLAVKRDDGAVVYINGTEVFRTNMPTGTISNTTRASANAADEGSVAQTISLSATALASGNNVIAVEIHQSGPTSSDIFFDLQLKASAAAPAATITRGPYLQMVNQTAATLRWRTDIATNSRIELGTSHGTYTLSASDAAVTTEHIVRISGLQPETKYYYRFGSSTQMLQAGTDNYLITAPANNSSKKVTVAVFGDCGRNDNGYQSQTLTAYRNYTGANPAELMLLLGDNAYTNGTDAEYQSQFFNVYQGNILKNHALFHAQGNHDYYSTSQSSRDGAYYQNFSMPTAAECGGLASGTEAWYSYNWGNVHFLSLDSYGTESPNNTRLYDTTGPQVSWIKNDLAANTKKWTVVYWHHPPFTMGSHNSDTETELVNIRQNFIRILERYGVDLILCGHSHDYERSYLLKDYFGNEASFNLATHAVTSSSGQYNGTANSCAYTTANGQVNHGTVYVVSGSAGASGSTQAGYPHNAMPWSLNDGGMFYFEVDDNRLDAKFIRRTGVVWDQFTIMKGVNASNTITINAGEQTTLTASWPGSYQWSTGATSRSITVSPTITTTYSVTDAQGCLQDSYTVQVMQALSTQTKTGAITKGIKVYPVPAAGGQQVFVETAAPARVIIADSKGVVLQTLQVNGRQTIDTRNLPSGLYLVQTTIGGKTYSSRMIVQR
ncbi:MAG TPA: metallophosphoesterase [Phnomibacter sp.]|nr:metallophosphoesterase [Phnomibacter sp.]